MNGLGIFALKTLIVAVIFSLSAAFTVMACRDVLLDTFSGGPVFWARLENGLIKFADSPEIPPEKRARIIAALRKIHDKHQPYLDALFAKE
jgi:hypothetical protein